VTEPKCVLHRRRGMAPRARTAGSGLKPPEAALAQWPGGERFGKRRDETRQVCAGKTNESEPSATCRKRMDAIETRL
jgi:hypothetical protein